MATNYEEDRLLKIGSEPIAKSRKQVLGRTKWSREELQRIVYLRRRQAFFYHVCQCVAQGGWAKVQELLNEFQHELEDLYGTSAVECVNVYRKNNTKDDGICIIMIFKIGPIERRVSADTVGSVEAGSVSWWQRVRSLIAGKPDVLRLGGPPESSL